MSKSIRTSTNTKDDLTLFQEQLKIDLEALSYMIKHHMMEDTHHRIGFSQEFSIVDKNWKPSKHNQAIVDEINSRRFLPELAKYNLEYRTPPMEISHKCFSTLHKKIKNKLVQANRIASSKENYTLLSGIIPTIRRVDIGVNNITQTAHFYTICKTLSKLRKGPYQLFISGKDELQLVDESPLVEGITTGFHIHLQVPIHAFIPFFNLSQAIAAPLLAISTNSPILFGKMLWQETRIAMSMPCIEAQKNARICDPRYTFGDKWAENIIDIYNEDINHYKSFFKLRTKENALDKVKEGNIPQLNTLRLHNTTSYKWNRPSYGVIDGIPHLRLENRILPAGPSVVDQIANSLFWVGLMYGFRYQTAASILSFEQAKNNFIQAAKYGIKAKLEWDGEVYTVKDLILNKLMDVSKQGLNHLGIHKKDIRHYLQIIEERVQQEKTGALWMIDSFEQLNKTAAREESLAAITATSIRYQSKDTPLHLWEKAKLDHVPNWEPVQILVEECMSRKLYSIRPERNIQEAVAMIKNERIRYIVVTNEKRKLIGLITAKKLLQEYSDIVHNNKEQSKIVQDIMIHNPITISPDAKITKAMDVMKQYKIGCLPVVKDQIVIATITEQNFLNVSHSLINRIKK